MFHRTKNQGAEINPKVDELNVEAETLAHLECLQLSP
ncbi:unnamed protein product [Arabidopsis thaliana]|uniref:(thale cress) hypothetical protein n=1 Tax=Arabidopsis thaliana TaxID=3702 RepID=A0A7G2EH45_ARATH|nr:unnamed protein product [Arabidopsis thaliana]